MMCLLYIINSTNVSWKSSYYIYNVYIIPYHLNVQGFICPICMEALRSAEALQVHWEAAHSSDRGGGGGGGGANAVSTKLKPQYVTCYIHYIMYVRYTLACALMILIMYVLAKL